MNKDSYKYYTLHHSTKSPIVKDCFFATKEYLKDKKVSSIKDLENEISKVHLTILDKSVIIKWTIMVNCQ